MQESGLPDWIFFLIAQLGGIVTAAIVAGRFSGKVESAIEGLKKSFDTHEKQDEKQFADMGVEIDKKMSRDALALFDRLMEQRFNNTDKSIEELRRRYESGQAGMRHDLMVLAAGGKLRGQEPGSGHER